MVYVINVQLPGNSGAEVTHYDAKIEFDISRESSNDEPYYVLSFVGGAWLSMATIEMTGSPGAIEIINVTNVQITNSSFR